MEEKKIKMVVFDWAGTTVDYGSSAPAEVFAEIFEEAGIRLTREEINGPMGMEKKAHIRALLSLEEAGRQWEACWQRPWNEEDVEALYERFEEKLAEVVARYSVPIEDVVLTVGRLRKMGLKIGSTTGYNAQMMKNVIPVAEAGGYHPDCIVTPDVTGQGRPSPFMVFECMRQLNVYPPKSVVKVGDTVADILEGKNAGAWSIGILEASNLLGLTKAEYDGLSEEELSAKKEAARRKYLDAGADLVINSIRELPEAVEKLNQALKGEYGNEQLL